MSDAARRLATYADLLALPDDVRAEVVAGAIITTPAPLPKHSKAQRALGRFIGGPYDDDDGPVVDVQIFVPHPSGSGNMVLRSVCPRGTSSVEESLSVMKELLTHVS